MKHKAQHIIPKSYLKAWCDPDCPKNQTPFIWIHNKEGTISKRKSPEKSLIETDFYTIVDENGNRVLDLEHGLAGLESSFINIRKTKIDRRKNLSSEDKLLLSAFTAAMKARTKMKRDHQEKQWGQALERMDQIKEWAKTATVEQKRFMSTIERGEGPSLNYDQVKRMAERPIQTLLAPEVAAATPIYNKMALAVFETDKTSSFITSDSPCVWFDPEAYKRPPLYRSPGLACKTIEVTLPVSPTHLLLFNWQGLDGYIAVNDKIVDSVNRKTRFHCYESFIVNGNYKKSIWFDPGIEPEDSWEKVRSKK